MTLRIDGPQFSHYYSPDSSVAHHMTHASVRMNRQQGDGCEVADCEWSMPSLVRAIINRYTADFSVTGHPSTSHSAQ